MNYTLNFTNMPVGITANNTCILNQYQLMENTARLPSMIFWISLIISATLIIIYIILPQFNITQKIINNIQYHGTLMATALSIWPPLIALYFTFNLNTTQLKTIETTITIISIIIILSIIIKRLWDTQTHKQN